MSNYKYFVRYFLIKFHCLQPQVLSYVVILYVIISIIIEIVIKKALRAKNITDEGYCLTIFAQPFAAQLNGVNPVAMTQPQRCAVGTPSTWGIDFKYNF